jgi:class 3 adenylate cyclase/predicted ATPase
MLGQILELLQSQRRMSYRAIKRRFDVDDDYLRDLKEEILFAHLHIVDEEGRGLVWTDSEANTMRSPQSDTSEEPSSSTVKTPVTAPPPDAERRQLTVMFCDLVDSTRLAGQLDPEDLREVVRAYQERAAGVIQLYEGHIAQYLGDGLLVYFGWPRAHEDDAQRAVHTGLGIVEAVDDLNTTLATAYGVQLAVRLGIHTGPVVVGEMGSRDRHENLALGETPNIAARLQGLTQPGTMVISDATRRLVAGTFDYDALGAPELKGVSESMPVFRVRGRSTAASRFEATTTTLTPMVGREVEVDLLMRCWEQVLEGEGQVVLLNGPPGIGKSRLLQALCERLHETPHTRLRYQCSPYHTNSAFYPIVTQMTHAMQAPLDALPSVKLDRLEALLAQLDLPVEESMPLFATMLSIPTADRYPPLTLSPQRRKERTIELYAQGLVNLARREPVLLLFEDVHWIDPTSLEALGCAINQVQDVRVLVALTHRPEFESPWSGHSHVMTYTLNRLSRRQTTDLIGQVTGGKGLPAEVLGQIVDRTDGIPLFVEELTKHVLESEWLVDRGESYALTGALPPLAIPATLQDSLMARLDRLAPVKNVVQLGASIGREFSYTLLRAISPLSNAELQEALNQLLHAELLTQRGSGLEATYSFKHALIQDTAYQSLLRSTRQQFHQQIAQVLETQFPETVTNQPEMLAHHYTEAGLHEQAVDYWGQAGHRASEHSTYQEASAHLRKGLEVLQMLPQTVAHAMQELTLQITLGPALTATQGYASPEVEQAYSRARELGEQVGELPEQFRALQGLWNCYFVRAQHQTARGLGEQLLELAEQTQDSGQFLGAYRALGSTLYFLGEFASAHKNLEKALALYDRNQHHGLALHYGADPGVVCLNYAAYTSWQLGFPEQGLQRIQMSHQLSEALSHPFSIAFDLNVAAWFHQYRREPHIVEEHTRRNIVLSTEQGFAQWLTMATILQGWSLAMQGEGEEGIRLLQQGLSDWQMMAGGLSRPYFLALLAEAYRSIGRPEDGLATLAEAQRVADETGESWYEAERYRLKGELLLAQSMDQQLEAESCFGHALDVARGQQAKSFELRTATSLARLWQHQEKPEDARQLLGIIYGWFTEGFDTADLQEAKALLMELS